jgi:hypothetical protein
MQRSDLLRAIIVGWMIAAIGRRLAPRDYGAPVGGNELCCDTNVSRETLFRYAFLSALGVFERADVFDFRVLSLLCRR